MSDGQGTFLGRYRLGEVLGRGAMGVVYEAYDPKLKGRKVAIKTILKSQLLDPQMAAEYSARFDTEAGNVASLNHPNIVTVYDFGNEADVAYLVMEFIDGKELKNYLDARHLFGIDEAVGIVCNLLDALDYAHEKFIYHRDIKPANVMIDVRGRVKLTDFGVARQSDGTGNDGTRAGTMVGTPSYMSPEQIKGLPAQAAADLFATGVVLYQCLTLNKPFTGGSEWEIWQKIVNKDPPPLSQFRAGVPPALERALLRALAKEPKDRPPTAAAMIADLKASIAGASFDPDATRIVSRPASGSARDESSPRPAGASQAGSTTGSRRGATVPPAFTQQDSEIELEFWRSIKDSGDREEFQLFLERFPSGTYSDLARRKMSKLGGNAVADDTDASVARQIEEQEAKVRQMRADQERRIAEAERERELARQRVEEARLEQIRVAEEARLREEEAQRLREEAAARVRAEEEAARAKAAEEEAARIRAAKEAAARARAAEAEAKRVEAEARRIAEAEEEARRVQAAEAEAARVKAAEEEASRVKAAQQEAARVKAAEEKAALASAAEEAAAREKALAAQAAREKAAAEAASRAKAREEAERIAAEEAALAGAPQETEAQRIERANERALAEASEEAARQLKRKKQADAERQAAEEREAAGLRAAAEEREAQEQQDATKLRKPDEARLAEEQWAAAEQRAAKQQAEAEAQRRREARIAESAPNPDEATRVIRPSDRAARGKVAAGPEQEKAAAAAAQAAQEQQARQAAEAAEAAEAARAAAVAAADIAGRERHAIASAIDQEVREVAAARAVGTPPRASAGKAPLFLGIGAAVLVLAGGAFMLTSKNEAATGAKSEPAQPDRAVVVETPAPAASVPSGPARIVTPPQPAPAAASAVASAAPPPAPDLRAEKEAAKRAEAQRLADLKTKEQKEQKELAARKAGEDAKLAEENKAKEAAAQKLRDEAAKATAAREEAAKKELAGKAKAKELADQKARDDAAAQQRAKELAEQKTRDEEKARAAQKPKVKADPDTLFAQAQRAEQEGRTREAVDLYKQAYGAGSGRAARMLGEIYGRGSGDVGRDYAEQLQWYEKAKAAGVDVPTPGKRKY